MSQLREKQTVVSSFSPPHVSVGAYVQGFVSCVVLTLAAYFSATEHWFGRNEIIGVVAGLAILQCIIQLIRFLHLDNEFKPRWKLLVFSVMLTVVLILVIGSLWIMDSLNYRMMESPSQTDKYLQSQDGL